MPATKPAQTPAKANLRFGKKILAFAAILALSGCATTPDEADGAKDAASDSSSAADAAQSDAASSVDSTPVVAPVDPDIELRQTRVFYFDYDLAKIKSSAFEPLKAHARYLAANRTARVRLEGHCDERGTREYNIALGERRGNAVAKFLKVQGVSASQIEVVSYGEEKPAALGHSEQAWAQNRRVELVY